MIAVTLLSSCKKDDDGISNSLKGTAWEQVDTYTEYDGIECVDTYTLRFTSETAFTLSVVYLEGGVNAGTDSDNGTYTYNPSTAVAIMTHEGETVTATVKGNKLILDEGTEDEWVFTRK